ncbi:MAG: methyl-accepting chemotaxis protein [Oligoflexia bacterium]|nr:methyl-accepting chemotaxis protein [Oligoflexia bacterium]
MNDNKLRVGFVGGGKGGLELLKVLIQSSLVEVAFVCDRNSSAPGVVFARSHGIDAISDFTTGGYLERVDFVFEVTGVPVVMEALRGRLEARKIINNEAAFFLFRVMADYSRQMNAGINREISHISGQITENTGQTRKILENIRTISNELKIISLNMSVEAARLGSQAAGFTIIATKVQDSVKTVKSLADQIEKINGDMTNTIHGIEAARRKLSEEATQ